MDTINQRTPEVAMIMANGAPTEDSNLYWLISKKQVEYILTDIAELPSNVEQPRLQRAQYQGQVLPVLSLEKYYGLAELPPTASYRYIVTKYPNHDGRLTKVILRFCNPIRVRRLTFEATPAEPSALRKNGMDILGAFTLPDNQLAIIPDFAAMLDNLAKT